MASASSKFPPSRRARPRPRSDSLDTGARSRTPFHRRAASCQSRRPSAAFASRTARIIFRKGMLCLDTGDGLKGLRTNHRITGKAALHAHPALARRREITTRHGHVREMHCHTDIVREEGNGVRQQGFCFVEPAKLEQNRSGCCVSIRMMRKAQAHIRPPSKRFRPIALVHGHSWHGQSRSLCSRESARLLRSVRCPTLDICRAREVRTLRR